MDLKKTGKLIGYFCSFILITSFMFLLLNTTKKVNSLEAYKYIVIIIALIVIAGMVLQRYLK